ncbi:hypothetical protein KAU92_04780 [Candidatus Bathyarchaeota archaeon]|nr:hypothetical protein [Candidatus Bathyarchaeota archaeon]
MHTGMHFIELNEKEILKLFYVGPISRRIYVILQNENSIETKELFIQRSDAFTANLIGLLNRVKEGTISEIRYACGFDGFIRIYLDEKARLLGEYSCKSEKSLKAIKQKIGMK